MNNIQRNIPVKTDQKDPNLGQTLPQKSSIEENVGQIITSLGSDTTRELFDTPTTVTKEPPIAVSEVSKAVTSNAMQTPSVAETKTESNVHPEKDLKSNVREKQGEILQNGISHMNNDGNLTDIILKDLENDFEDMLQNISESNTTAVPAAPTMSTVKTTNSQTKAKEKKESKNLNNTMLNTSIARANELHTSATNMASLGNAPPYPNGVGNMQMRPQVPSPMGLGPQIRRHLVDHIQGRGRQQVGPAPYGAMNSMPVREALVTATQTKNPETMAKVQEHLLFKKQMQQRQMEMMRQQMQQQMQQPYQQTTYQQQLMQMAQAAQQQQHSPSPMSPMMQSLTPHMQQQAFMQQNMSSPVPSPMSTTPVLNRNPFQFPHDYNAYMNQQKQMQAFEGMGNIQSQHEGASQMPINYYQGPQQEPTPFPVRQPMPNQGNMHASSMQAAAMRAMMSRERMMSPDSMPQGQMMQGPVVGPSGSFQSQAPKQPPPQYTQNNFSPPSIPLERPQLQRSLSHPRNRLSHFSHPEEMQSFNAPQSSVPMKSPGTLPMYPNMDNNMYSMGATSSSIANGVQQQNANPVPTRMTESGFSNFQSYGPPNMSLTSPMNSRTTMSPTSWAHESQLQKQQSLQHMRMNMNSEYRAPQSKGPTVNLNSRSNTVGQSRRNAARFSSPVEKHPSDVSSMAPNSMMSPQQGPKMPLGTSLKQEPIVQETSSQSHNPSDDLESILSDPPENFDLVKLLG